MLRFIFLSLFGAVAALSFYCTPLSFLISFLFIPLFVYKTLVDFLIFGFFFSLFAFLPLFKAFLLVTQSWFLALLGFLLAVFAFSVYQFGTSYLLVRLKLPLFIAYPLVELSRVFIPFDGFPLFNLGEVLANIPLLKFSIHPLTVYGASFLILLTNFLTLKLIKRELKPIFVFLFGIGVLTISLLGRYTLNYQPLKGKEFVIVQPFWQEEDQLKEEKKLLPYKILLLTRAAKLGNTILLPESFLGFKDFLNLFGWAFKDKTLLVGKNSVTFEGNKIYALNEVIYLSKGTLKDFYTKRKLVPFGEYTPNLLKFLEKFVPYLAGADYKPGKGVKIFSVNGLRLLPLICGEVFYPLEVPQKVDLVAVFANDAWFYPLFAKYHLLKVKAQAVETGKSFLFINSNGYSGLVLPNGTYIGRPFSKVFKIHL